MKNEKEIKKFLKEYFTIEIEGKTYPFMSRRVFNEKKKRGEIPEGIKPLPLKYAKKIEEEMK